METTRDASKSLNIRALRTLVFNTQVSVGLEMPMVNTVKKETMNVTCNARKTRREECVVQAGETVSMT